jgi:hypothetical protein
MSKLRFSFNILAVAAFVLTVTSMASAQATRTWVSGVGDDANPCSRTAPCKTFAGAISKTAVDGEINALDPGGFGAVTITKAITIDGGTTGEASILASLVTAVGINITASSGSNTVQLRNISMNGAGNGLFGVRIFSSNIANVSVFIENCVIFGFRATGLGQGRGISDERAVAGNLYVQNTLVKNNFGSGIVLIGANGPKTTLNEVQSIKNGGAGVVSSGSNRFTDARNCVGSHNGVAGFLAENSGRLDVIDSMAAFNPQGIESDSSAEFRVSRTTITRNTTNGLFLNGGTILSYGTNEVSANTGNETFTAGGPTLK